MLSVYARHYPPCPQTDSNYRRCRCPKWINSTLPTGKFVRMTARSRSWEIAERKARHFEVQADPLRKSEPAPSLRITIEHAIKDFLKDEEARCQFDNISAGVTPQLRAILLFVIGDARALGPDWCS